MGQGVGTHNLSSHPPAQGAPHRCTSHTWHPLVVQQPTSRPHCGPEAHHPCQGLGRSNPHPGWYLPRPCPSKSSVGTRWTVCGLGGPLPPVFLQSLCPPTEGDFSLCPWVQQRWLGAAGARWGWGPEKVEGAGSWQNRQVEGPLLTGPAPPCPCPALGRGWSGLRPARHLKAWATGVAWGRRVVLGAAGSRPRGGWAGHAAWGPPWGQKCHRRRELEWVWWQRVRPGWQGGAHTGRCPTPGLRVPRGDKG